MEPGLGKGRARARHAMTVALGHFRAVCVGAFLVVVWRFSAQIGGLSAADLRHFEAAHYAHGEIVVFPNGGKEFSVQLPPSLPATANLIGFASSGQSAYLQEPSAAVLHHSGDLIQVKFSPPRLFPVPGSGGLGEIISVTNSRSGNLLVAAAYGQGLCGAYEIDTSRGTHRPILTEPARPDCKFGVKQVEPDGERVLVGDFQKFRILDSQSGNIELSGAGRGTWSPDGKWLAVSRNGEIIILDGRSFAVRRRFRASSVDGHLVWAPDSNRILFAQTERRCFPQGDFESLAVLDVETGKTGIIPSSHCMVTNSQIGWIDMDVLSASTGRE